MLAEVALAIRYHAVRARSQQLCAPLAIEDHVCQPSIEVSPPKWHLGHTTWFFETLVLVPYLPGYTIFDSRYGYVFNSYYESQGARVARGHRGFLSRPTVSEVLAYRVHVNAALETLLAMSVPRELASLIELGLAHEQQHQELLITDIKAILGNNPLAPPYDPDGRGGLDLSVEHRFVETPTDQWVEWGGGHREIGHGGDGFSFDNERPRHTVLVPPFRLRTVLVTNREYLNFMEDGGYRRFEFWHAEGWDWVNAHRHEAPHYWRREEQGSSQWMHYTLQGMQPVEAYAPVTHISAYEAAAFCAWAGWRLPTEQEWEALEDTLKWGQRWEWTASAYAPYPGFQVSQGAVSEYNGKFMINQMVLRGASYATPHGHARATYRNFFHPHLRWQYTGIRPACTD